MLLAKKEEREMEEIKIEVKGYKCERCGHEWIPRKKEYPTLCPNCKSAYWDKPARKKK